MSKNIYKIFPPLNFARVGNSEKEYYIGPETAGGLPILPDGGKFTENDFRDQNGKMKRQAARYRVYRFDENGENPDEITLDSKGVKSIEWTVHLANKKSIWYDFQTYEGENGYASNHPLRNPDVTGTERTDMIIDPGPRTIHGENADPVEFSRESTEKSSYKGTFPQKNLKPFDIDTLGELRTDEKGRLLVLGGYGNSGSSNKKGPKIKAYANNDKWWDDTSDGPVRATISLTSGNSDLIETIEVEPAWVSVTPPAYAPEIFNLVTLYDTIFDVSVRKMGGQPDIFENEEWKIGPDGYKPDFETEIKPLIERGSGYSWVAAIPPKPHKFPYEYLGDPNQEIAGMRQYVLDVLRGPGENNTIINGKGATMMPYLAGDGAVSGGDPGKLISKYLRLTDTQYFMLQQWADGHFTNSPAKNPSEITPDGLTRAVLENCVGGAFSPGIEMTWVSRLTAIYSEPFRVKVKKPVEPPLSLGMNTDEGLEPGDLTKFMAIPWQADFNECSSQPVDGRVLWWWPSQRPEIVKIKVEDKKTGKKHLEQVPWIGSDYDQSANGFISFPDDLEMVKKWMKLGFIFNVGNETEPEFIEVARTLHRES